MKKITLAAEARENTGKQAAKAIRRAGRVPAALYGPRMDSTRSLSVDRRELERLTQSDTTTLVSLEFPSEEPIQSLLKSHQSDRVRGTVIHADFYQVADDHILHTAIPVEISGTAAGVRVGGVLERPFREVEIECYPRDLPEHLMIDVTALEIGDSLHVSDLDLPSGVTIRSPEASATLVQVVQPRAVLVEAEVEGEAAAEGAAPAEGEAAGEGDGAAKGGGEG